MKRTGFCELVKKVCWGGTFMDVILQITNLLENENDKGRHFDYTEKGTPCSLTLAKKQMKSGVLQYHQSILMCLSTIAPSIDSVV